MKLAILPGNMQGLSLQPIGIVQSQLTTRRRAPNQNFEGAPGAFVRIYPFALEALEGIRAGQEIVLITWFHRARRDLLRVHPRSLISLPLTGVFATRSPDRPNPLGLHRVTVRSIESDSLEVAPLEAIDGTPVLDIKPVLAESEDY
jgi:tRNA-Thr(GGU) m(6)t(6)A37 methyltransferase TsaA